VQSTLTESPPGPASDAPRTDVLVRVLDADRPLAPSERFELHGVDEVHLGRAEAHAATVDAAAHRLTLGVADRWMSGQHARLSRVLRAWVLEDLGSKNGVRRNGELVTRAELADGDVLELGRTAWVFRAGQPRGAPFTASPAALATWNGELARRFEALRRIAGSGVSVVLRGESGSGKELVARAVHALSGRPGPFIAVNCGALPDELVESELFGHRRGAFSGATEDRPGLVRAAHGGTLFLDEVGDLPLEAQPALLRVLQERQVVPVGGTAPVPVELRVVSATHRDLEGLAQQGLFREDLLARLSGYELVLPALRERREDLGLLVSSLLERLAPARTERVQLHVTAARALMLAPWRLNVRELEKALEAAVVLAGDGPVELAHLPEHVRTPAAAPPPEVLDDADAARKAELERLLAQHGGNISAVARELGKARMQIQRWLARYELDPRRFRP
jgi:transcriptional regulator with PAS, ATPase and Fis domain